MDDNLRESLTRLLDALRCSDYPLSPRVSRELARVEMDLRQPGSTVNERCSGSGQRIWRDGSRHFKCDTCGQKFQDFMTTELVCDDQGWMLPAHDRRQRK
jgi:hypothetical protein